MEAASASSLQTSCSSLSSAHTPGEASRVWSISAVGGLPGVCETLGTVFGTKSEKQDLGSEGMYFLLPRHLIQPQQLHPRHSTCRAASLLPLCHPFITRDLWTKAVRLFGSCLGTREFGRQRGAVGFSRTGDQGSSRFLCIHTQVSHRATPS